MERTNRDLLKKYINELINIRNEIDTKNEELSKLREDRCDIESEINNLLYELNLEQKIFILNENKIQKKSYIQYQSFSIKYLEEKLNEYFISNHLNVNLKNIISFLFLVELSFLEGRTNLLDYSSSIKSLIKY